MEEFVPYQPSLDLKELGFDKPCFGFYIYNNKLLHLPKFIESWNGNENRDKNISHSAPTFSQAFRWFREKYKLSGEPKSHQFYFMYQIIYDTLGENACKSIKYNFESYEEAELECLKKLIEIVKDKK